MDLKALRNTILAILCLFLANGCTVIGTASPTPEPTIQIEISTPFFPPTYTPAPSATSDQRFQLYKAQGQTVTLWHPWTGVRGTALAQMVTAYNRENPHKIHVKLQAWGSADSLLAGLSSAQADGGDVPNLVVLAPEVIQGTISSPDGSLLDLRPYLYAAESDISSAIADEMPAGILLPVRAGERIYGLPAVTDSPILIYNRSWAKELGFQADPITPTDFKQQLCAAATSNNHSKDRSTRGTGGWLEDTSLMADLGWLSGYTDTLPFTSDGTEDFSSAAIEQTLAELKDLSATGCTWTGRNPIPLEYFTERKALMISLPASQVQSFWIATQAAQFTDNWAVLSYPSEQNTTSWTAFTSYYSILRSAPEQDLAAWLVLRWLTDPENETRLALSDGSLPVSQTGWKKVQSAGTLPVPLAGWMAGRDEPQASPYLKRWSLAGMVLSDGFKQVLQSNVTADQIPEITGNMQNFLEEMEKQQTEWQTITPSTSTPTVPVTPTPEGGAGGSSSSPIVATDAP